MRLTIALCSCLTFGVIAQEKTVWEERPALLLSNDALELTVTPQGGAMTRVTLVDDEEKISPLWNPFLLAREAGLNRPAGFGWGHFVCVDGFGPPSSEERAAGLSGHGEAYTLPWDLRSYEKQGNTLSATFKVILPLAQEALTRTFRMVDGENVVWVESDLENLLSLDRPVFWAEHAKSARHSSNRERLPSTCRSTRRRRRRIRCNQTRIAGCSRTWTSAGQLRRWSMAGCSTCVRLR